MLNLCTNQATESKLYEDHNNLFGMKPAYKRDKLYDDTVTYTTSDGQETFASFASPELSLIDRVNRDVQFGIAPPEFIEDIARYMAQIVASGYATDTSYLKKWAKHVIKLNPNYIAINAALESGQYVAEQGTELYNKGANWFATVVESFFNFLRKNVLLVLAIIAAFALLGVSISKINPLKSLKKLF